MLQLPLVVVHIPELPIHERAECATWGSVSIRFGCSSKMKLVVYFLSLNTAPSLYVSVSVFL